MPIKGLTDGEAAFPCIGILRKGSKKEKRTKQGKDGKTVEYEIQGKDLEHFRFDSRDSKAIADFDRAYRRDGKEATEVNVRLPYETTERNFFTCKEEWGAGGLIHRCDGESCTALRVGKLIQRQFMAPVACPGGCKQIGRLQVIIPELKRFAYVTAETHSINDIVNLHNQLKAVEITFGRLKDIPFVLKRQPTEISTPTGDGDKRARREKWMLSIEVDPRWSEMQINARDRASFESANVVGALPYAVEERPTVQRAIAPKLNALPLHPIEEEPFQEISMPDDVRESVKRGIGADLKRLGWTSDRGKEFISRRFNVESSAHLTDAQLLEFSAHLSSIPSPAGVYNQPFLEATISE